MYPRACAPWTYKVTDGLNKIPHILSHTFPHAVLTCPFPVLWHEKGAVQDGELLQLKTKQKSGFLAWGRPLIIKACIWPEEAISLCLDCQTWSYGTEARMRQNKRNFSCVCLCMSHFKLFEETKHIDEFSLWPALSCTTNLTAYLSTTTKLEAVNCCKNEL